jgi:tetratricopeptide (TPR) repeat protein
LFSTTQTRRTHAVVVNRSPFNMLNQYRYHAGQFSTELTEIKLSGEDVRSFLQNQSTFDVKLLTPNSFHLTSFLDPQGRVESYGWLIFVDNSYFYLVPKSLTEKSLERLNKFLISEDVTIHDSVDKKVNFIIGPKAKGDGAEGILFGEKAILSFEVVQDIPLISVEDIETWRGLTGWPKFDGSDYSYEILNNLRLFDLTLTPNKGCYPGQETVSKIATRRGAAYSPVLLELSQKIEAGEIKSFDKKIGTAFNCYEWNGSYFLSCSLLRDFRVENMQVSFTLNDQDYQGKVRYFPLLSGDLKVKAEELFYEAAEDFKHEKLKEAEEKFRLAIDLDPTYADAYESLGVMLGRQERFQEAIDLMQKLSEVNPKSVLAHTNMSLYLMKVGKITEAEEQKSLATIKSFQSFGDEADRKEQEEARKKELQSEWAQRESMFRQVLEIDPEDTLANYGLGSIAVEKGEWDTARIHLETVLKQDPKYSVAYLALGKALKGLGKINEAQEVWREGIKVAAAKGDLMPANQMQQELIS